MANREHVDMFQQGIEIWNQWRFDHPGLQPDLSGASDLYWDSTCPDVHFFHGPRGGYNLFETDLSGSDLQGGILNYSNCSQAIFQGSNLKGALISESNLTGADFQNAILDDAVLNGSNLTNATLNYASLVNSSLIATVLEFANLCNANLQGAILSNANLTNAYVWNSDLRKVNLECAYMLQTHIENSDISGSSVYGISTWDVELINVVQNDLIVTSGPDASITVDNLEVAQFVYLLIKNEKIRDILQTVSQKVVLILGRFKRWSILNALKEELRQKYDYIPVIFDFEKSPSSNYRDTVTALACMSRFIIADLTLPAVIHQELEYIKNIKRPIQPILQNRARLISTYHADFGFLPHILPIVRYRDLNSLLEQINERVITPAEVKANELSD